ncbi:MAG: CinA family protein [Pseudomonadota bacterium]
MSASAENVLEAARSVGAKLATAESCTGGLIAAALTDVAGSSAVFDCGFVTYSNEAKAQMLGVDPSVIDENGAVSHEVAAAMATGAIGQSGATHAISVTGIAGPGGGSAEKPVGLVFMALATPNGVHVRKHIFRPDGEVRTSIRQQTVAAALNWFYETLSVRP